MNKLKTYSMKKTFLLSLLLTLLGTISAWAQFNPEAGKMYALKENTSGLYLDIQTLGIKDGNRNTNNISLNDKPCIIFFEKGGTTGTWKIKNANGQYVYHVAGDGHWNPEIGTSSSDWTVIALNNGAYTLAREDGKLINVDSAEVVHGLFEMQGEVDSAQIASLYMDDQSIMPLVLESGKIQIVIDNARSYVKGTPLNDKLYDFVAKKNSLENRAYELERSESRMIMDGKSSDEIEAEITKARESLSNEMDGLVKGFISDNYENVLGPGVFMMLCNSFPYPVLTPVIEEIVDQAPECFKNDSFVQEYMKVARSNKK
jgi:hypothetical protein